MAAAYHRENLWGSAMPFTGVPSHECGVRGELENLCVGLCRRCPGSRQGRSSVMRLVSAPSPGLESSVLVLFVRPFPLSLNARMHRMEACLGVARPP